MLIALSDDTIVALATAEGGALGVIRVSGPRAHAAGRALLFTRAGTPRFPEGTPIEPRRVVHALVRDARGAVDECLAHFARHPASYTGEDTLELSAHGGPATLRRIIDACLAAGCRMAAPGEFTRRAFLNGKLDLPRAEAVGDLVAARTERARESSFLQLSGAHSAALVALRERLLALDARVEAWLDHPEEDIDPVEPAELAEGIARIEGEVREALSRARFEIALREGVEVAVCGRPNVGKSSLFNRLLGRARAIVSDTPGTTRDVVGETLSLGGVPVRLLDTAGLRDGGDEVEAEGRRRALQALSGATLRLVVLDGSSPLAAQDRDLLGRAAAPRLLAVNKSDLPRRLDPSDLPDGEGTVEVSCLTGSGFPELEAALARALGAAPRIEGLLVTNARQAACLEGTRDALAEARGALDAGLPFDLVADSLRRAARGVSEILGECFTEELLDRIFSTFCIGK